MVPARPAPARRAPARSTPLTPLAAALVLGCGCATYTQRSAQALADFERGRFEEARVAFEGGKVTDSAFLAPAEAGMVSLAAGDWARAQAALHAAAEAVREIEDRALVSATALGEGLLSWTLSEGAKRYEGEGYERVMLHAALAMTYLAQGALEGVWVEVQRANKLLESEEELYEKEYAAGGLGHFLSAVAYELFGELDDAYIDYARMEEKGVGVELAGRALVRLGTLLDREDQLPQWIERYGPVQELPQGAASVVLIAGVGLAPTKVEHGFAIPTPDGVIQWAVPGYVRRPQAVSGLELVERASDARVRSVVVEDVARVAHENLEDRIGWLAAKSAVRATLKYQLTRKLSDDHGAVGWLAGSLLTIATERADLRSWLTLPDAWHGARMFVAPGVHELELRALGGGSVALGTYELEPGETLVVLARTLGARLYAYPIGGRRLDGPALTQPTVAAPSAAATPQP